MPQERLQKIIAAAGIASRRAAEKLVADGRVRVNGRIVTELGAKADPRHDRIEVDGKRITREKLVYLVFHKPKNVVSTLADPEGRPTVKEYFATMPARVYPVGRLDYAQSGVMLFTNDGDFAQALTHPKQKVAKTFVVKLDREMPEDEVVRWRGGIDTPDGRTAPADVRLLRYEGGKTWLEITFSEGHDPIRRMAEASGYVVMRMARLSFAGVEATDLRPGQWRPMTLDEQKLLKRAYGVPKSVRAQEELTTARSGRPAPVTAPRTGRPAATPRAAARSAPRERAPADRRSSPGRS